MILNLAAYLLAALLGCEPAPRLAAAFTPRRPLVGRYDVCTTGEPIAAVVSTLAGVTIETVEPFDAFGGAGPYDRFAVARLYLGVRPHVAHSWIPHDTELESDTFISPYPDPTFTRLLPGTLVIRFFVPHDLAR
jgi:hypothetical protein